jgi:mannose-1-phosphate guanylyltransferase
MVVTGRAHAEAVRHEVGASADVVVEPTPRNSMPAIALAAALVEREDPDSVIGSFAADHVIADVEAFHAAVTTARRAAESGYLVTIGITPTHAATGFGYIEIDEAEEGDETDGGEAEGTLPAARSRGDLPDGALPVHRFVEKPDAGTAQRFLDSGSFLWNAGMFVMRARALLDALAEQIPPLAAGVREIAASADTASTGTTQYEAVLERIWPTLTAIAIDHALAEPLSVQGRVAVVPADPGWDDIGDFPSLARQLRVSRGDEDVVTLGGARTVAAGSVATVYGSTERLIALVGLDHVSVVDGEDVLLVLDDAHASDLSALVGALDEKGLGALR